MKPRATRRLAELPDDRLFIELAQGLSLLTEHVQALSRGLEVLETAQENRAREPLRMLADEEAAKFLILVDAARCDRRAHSDWFARQLARFGDHLAKGIYAEAADWRPATVGDLVSYIEPMRKSLYLDGPNDVDWVFRNEVEAAREERLYVDYIDTDEGLRWHSPSRWDDIPGLWPSGAARLVEALEGLGVATEAGLRAVASRWRPVTFDASTRWSDLWPVVDATVRDLIAAGGSIDDRGWHLVRDAWAIPMYGLDMSRIKVDINELRKQQEAWDPGW